MPVSKYYKPLAGVRIPGDEDPVEISRQGNNTSMEFGFGPEANIEAAQQYGRTMGARRPVTQSEIGEDALMRSQLGVPDIPLDLLQFGRGVPQMPAPLANKPAKSAETYGTNRGGFGGAGRGTQFGDMPGLQPLEMNDKPWELDDNTNADVQSGVSLTPKPEENVVDKEPDLQSPRGLYQALAKKYPDILTQNLDQLQKSRVTEEDLEGLSDRAGLGSLFIAASKAASGAGSIGGKTAESIAPTIVNREDILARQRLKDRMDVASENMQMNAKAVDLAMKQIDFADEREQYDPNSDVSQFARDFMKQEFGVDVPNNVPAYQLKQFLPAVVQKYQAQERASYQSALLGQKTAESLLNDAYKRYQTATQSGDKQKQIEAQKEIARLREMAKAEPKPPKPEKMRGSVPQAQADAEFKLADKFNAEPSVIKFKAGNIALQEMENLILEATAESDQGLINGYAKALDPTSAVMSGEYATVEEGGGIVNQVKNLGAKSLGKARLQPEQRQKLLDATRALQRGRQSEYQRIRQRYEKMAKDYELDVGRSLGTDDVAPTGEAPATLPSGRKPLTPEERQKLEKYRNEKGAK